MILSELRIEMKSLRTMRLMFVVAMTLASIEIMREKVHVTRLRNWERDYGVDGELFDWYTLFLDGVHRGEDELARGLHSGADV